MENKNKKFNNLVFETFNTLEFFDKINYSFKKIRKVLIEDTPEFKNLSVKLQFDLCLSIYHVCINSKRSMMNDISILLDKDKDESIKKYDIEYGFIEPQYIEIINNQGIKTLVEKI